MFTISRNEIQEIWNRYSWGAFNKESKNYGDMTTIIKYTAKDGSQAIVLINKWTQSITINIYSRYDLLATFNSIESV